MVSVESNSPFGSVVTFGNVSEVLDSDGVGLISDLVRRESLVIVRAGVRPQLADVESLVRMLGQPILNPDGSLNQHDLYARDSDRFDRNFTEEALPLHWDGWSTHTFRMDLQVYWCMEQPADGTGRTTFSDTRSALASLPAPLRQKYDRTKVWYQLPKSGMENVFFSHGLVEQHPRWRVDTIRFAENFANSGQKLEFEHPDFVISGEFYDEIVQLLYQPEFFYAHSWRQGDIVVADNNSLLHGRTAFQGQRRIIRYGVNLE